MTAKAPSGWAIVVVRVAWICLAILGWRAFETGAAGYTVLGGLAIGAGTALALWGTRRSKTNSIGC